MEQMSFNFSLEPQHRDYKARNILTVAERVKVIREYERNPVYQRIAEQFNCSSKQIKNIIANKDSILRYQNESHGKTPIDESRRRRHQKIIFLGKVIYEYLLRAVYHGVAVSAGSIRQKALQVSESIAIENFFPNTAWVHNFKVAYNIPEFDLDALQKSINFFEPKGASFNCIDIIQYVSKCERNDAMLKQGKQLNQLNASHSPQNDASDMYSTIAKNTCGSNSSGIVDDDENDDDDEPTVAYESNDSNLYLQPDQNSNSKESAIMSLGSEDVDEMLPLPSRQSKRPRLSEANNSEQLADISTYKDALRHLKVLEDFAMLEDNYRAIGLITQLEHVFKNPAKSQDFEV